MKYTFSVDCSWRIVLLAIVLSIWIFLLKT